MTAEEIKTLDDFTKKFASELTSFGAHERGNIGYATGLFRKLAAEYASQQRTEGIKEGFEAARDVFRECSDGCEREHTYFDVEDYLSTKR